MAFNLADIFGSLKTVLELEKKVEDLVSQAKEAIASEKDKKRREAISKAFDSRDLDALRRLLFE
jgi:ABC-type enterochelin transport system substrate-binding protein